MLRPIACGIRGTDRHTTARPEIRSMLDRIEACGRRGYDQVISFDEIV
jgi:hypothetical protein